MIGIVGAMEVEVTQIQSLMTDTKNVEISGRTFVCGKLNGCDAVVVQCGVSKVNAAMCTEALILNFHPDVVINSGVGGSLSQNLSIGDIAVGESVVQHDVDTTVFGDPVGFVSTVCKVYFETDKQLTDNIEKAIREEGIKLERGIIASGDQFITNSGKAKILANFDAICAEMEAGAIGQVCYINQVPFGIIRSISDNANGDSVDDYPAFVKKAADIAAKVAMRVAAMYANA